MRNQIEAEREPGKLLTKMKTAEVAAQVSTSAEQPARPIDRLISQLFANLAFSKINLLIAKGRQGDARRIQDNQAYGIVGLESGRDKIRSHMHCIAGQRHLQRVDKSLSDCLPGETRLAAESAEA